MPRRYQRAEIMGGIAAACEIKSLQRQVGRYTDIVIDGPSEESDFILSARELCWAPDIDGEVYINDRTLDEDLEFNKIYKGTITALAGTKLLCTIDNLK